MMASETKAGAAGGSASDDVLCLLSPVLPCLVPRSRSPGAQEVCTVCRVVLQADAPAPWPPDVSQSRRTLESRGWWGARGMVGKRPRQTLHLMHLKPPRIHGVLRGTPWVQWLLIPRMSLGPFSPYVIVCFIDPVSVMTPISVTHSNALFHN